MRICLYSETVLPKLGGQEMVVDALARHLLARDHEVVVLAPQPRRRYVVDDTKLPYPVVRHPRFFSTHRFVGWYRWWLRSLYRQRPFDVVHAHSVYPCGWIAALCGAALPTPLVITSHGGDVRAGNVRLQKRGMVARHEQAVTHAEALIAISRFTAEGFRRLGARDEQIVSLPNGVDLEPFKTSVPRPYDLDDAIRANNYVLFLGRLHHRKGVDLLLDALARIEGQGVQLVIAGDGEERTLLTEHAQCLGITERVRFVGRVSGAKKVWLLQNSRAVVLPSREWEAFPLVVLEAFAARRGVIGTRIPGLGDLIEPRETGLLVDPERADELAAALQDALSNTERWTQFGAQARTQAEAASWPLVAEQHEQLYARLIAQRDQRRAA